MIDDLKANFSVVRNHSYIASRLIVFISGLGAVACAFGAKSLTSTVLQAAMSVNGIVAGPVLGLFTIGMFCPWVGSPAAFISFALSILISTTMYLNNNPTPEFTNILSCEFEIFKTLYTQIKNFFVFG